MDKPSGKLYYMQVVPNSHSYGCLNNIVINYEFNPEELTPEYLLIGFRNTLKRGLEIQKIDNTKKDEAIIFKSIADIIHYLENEPQFSTNMFVSLMKSTIASGYDLKPKLNMEKQEVYSRVDGELEYQQQRWVVRREANGTPDESKPPAEWLTYIQEHVNQANKAVYNLNDEEALAQIRKITALGVRALMIHGCPEREIPEDLFDGE